VAGPLAVEPATESLGSHLDTEQLLSPGEKGVLMWWQARHDRDTWIPDGGVAGIEVYVDGKKTLLEDYELPAWALWIRFESVK
jgi:hypothetical protein